MIRTICLFLIAACATLAIPAQSRFTRSAYLPETTPERLSARQLQTLVSTAATTEDHERLAQYYQAKALEYRAEAEIHDAMLTVHQANSVMYNDKLRRGTIEHCYYMARSLKQRAAQAELLAQQQEEMAQATRAKSGQ
ncbi:MAG TPA: hypothetical protein VGL22_15975 [Terracidiphilus sp.]